MSESGAAGRTGAPSSDRVAARIRTRSFAGSVIEVAPSGTSTGAGSIMCAYNKVNGVYACEHPELLDRVARGQWGFAGWVMSDWGATHSAAPALEAGLDMEMPRGRDFESLEEAVESNAVPVALVDRAAGRILSQMERVGLLDGVPARPAFDEAAGADLARRVALADAVLLQNAGGALPLAPADLASAVIIGPTARTPLVGGGGSARVTPVHAEPTLDAIARRAGGEVRFAPGIDLDGVVVPASALSRLRRRAADGDEASVRTVDATGDDAVPAGAEWTWTGVLGAPVTGDYDRRAPRRRPRSSRETRLRADGCP